jgi:N-acetylglucosaminyl-diphospho-decaprenol L-rhamnosyltransferase
MLFSEKCVAPRAATGTIRKRHHCVPSLPGEANILSPRFIFPAILTKLKPWEYFETRVDIVKANMREFRGKKTNSEMNIPVTIIVLVYNTPDLLLQCLQSFYDTSHIQGWQIIVVDNGSDEDMRPIIGEKFDGVEVIRSERNLGFAAGNNLGLRRAKGEFVILMNSDVIVRAEILGSLTESLRKEPLVAAMSPGLLTAQGKPQEFAFGSENTPGYLIRRGVRSLLGFGPLHDWSTKEPLEVEWVSAACLCVRSKVIHEIGALDERFQLYFEDADWCLRMRAAGWKVVYNPHLQVIHLGGASHTRGPEHRQDLYYRSLVLFCEKHYGRGCKLLIRALLIVYRILAKVRSLVD